MAVTENEEWAVVLADYVRQNDQPLLEAGDSLLRFFEDDLVPVQSFAEFCDVLGKNIRNLRILYRIKYFRCSI